MHEREPECRTRNASLTSTRTRTGTVPGTVPVRKQRQTLIAAKDVRGRNHPFLHASDTFSSTHVTNLLNARLQYESVHTRST